MASRRNICGAKGQRDSWLRRLSCCKYNPARKEWDQGDLEMLELLVAPSNSAPIIRQTMWPVTFEWHHGGEEVALMGLWNEVPGSPESVPSPDSIESTELGETPPPLPQWTERSMEKLPSGHFQICVMLPEGKFHYSFVVDDVVTFDTDKQIVYVNGYRRNVVKINKKTTKNNKRRRITTDKPKPRSDCLME